MHANASYKQVQPLACSGSSHEGDTKPYSLYQHKYYKRFTDKVKIHKKLMQPKA